MQGAANTILGLSYIPEGLQSHSVSPLVDRPVPLKRAITSANLIVI
jgi:hypothetical protein